MTAVEVEIESITHLDEPLACEYRGRGCCGPATWAVVFGQSPCGHREQLVVLFCDACWKFRSNPESVIGCRGELTANCHRTWWAMSRQDNVRRIERIR